MIRFADGPAKYGTLTVRRHPLYLRVCRRVSESVGTTFDALDQLDDVPHPDEQLFAYVKMYEGQVHLQLSERGRRRGRWEACATYSLVQAQPDDATMRDTDRWQAWCLAQQAAAQAAAAPREGGPS